MVNETSVIPLFHSKLNELQKRYPLFQVVAVRQTFDLNEKQTLFNYLVNMDEDTSFYLNYDEKSLKKVDVYHLRAFKIKRIHDKYKNLKVFIEDPSTIWLNSNYDPSPVFADFVNDDWETQEQLAELQKKAEFIKENNNYFVCSHCHRMKEKSFLFDKVVNGFTCVACAEVDDEGSNY